MSSSLHHSHGRSHNQRESVDKMLASLQYQTRTPAAVRQCSPNSMALPAASPHYPWIEPQKLQSYPNSWQYVTLGQTGVQGWLLPSNLWVNLRRCLRCLNWTPWTRPENWQERESYHGGLSRDFAIWRWIERLPSDRERARAAVAWKTGARKRACPNGSLVVCVC